ncbi:MAG TPA: ATP-binding cassette domain-containing protein [Gammaproteobacteria bacterium]|mgnify:CR=1 FL=1|nr:ATP-binding cassette domain-containing protein [Gammaproteobacteria bacterium]
MSSQNTVITVQDVGKRYRLGLRDEVQDTLAATFFDMLKSPVNNFRKYRSLYKFDDIPDNGSGDDRADILWALRDVSFSVNEGEVLGIVGHNGAGKSTLLKILTRITPPTHGLIEMKGQVSSLLEVGTGFHPELTGRENIYLNGTVLGMRKKEVDRKFDEIVEFSGVEKFLDTPVKRYSSGMSVRLAFSVAAHLEPEILIIDEVLAVGDAEFQKKCIKKMQAVGREGRTVLFVSHNMPAVNMLCDRAILLDGGRMVHEGPVHDVVSAYLVNSSGTSESREWRDADTAPGGDVARLRAVRVRAEDGASVHLVDVLKPFRVDMEFEVIQGGYVLSPYFDFYNEADVHCFAVADLDPAWRKTPRPPGRYVSTVWVPPNLFNEGTIMVSVGLAIMKPYDNQFQVDSVVSFSVFDKLTGDSSRGDWMGQWGGAVRPKLKWSTDYTPAEVTGTVG